MYSREQLKNFTQDAFFGAKEAPFALGEARTVIPESVRQKQFDEKFGFGNLEDINLNLNINSNTDATIRLTGD